MSHAGQTLHYQLPQYAGTDIINPLVDTNDAYEAIDEAIYNVASSAATAVQTAQEVKEEIEGTGGVDSRISALVTRVDAVETKNVEQDTAILGVQQALATTNGNVATNTQNISDLGTTVSGHTTSIGNLNTRVQACENADAALDVRVTALENAPTPSMPTASDVSFDTTGTQITATNVQDAIEELAQSIGSNVDADDVSYSNASSRLAATNVQDAIDELAQGIGAPYDITSRTEVNFGSVDITTGGMVTVTNGWYQLHGENGTSGGTYVSATIRNQQSEPYSVYVNENPNADTAYASFVTSPFYLKAGSYYIRITGNAAHKMYKLS